MRTQLREKMAQFTTRNRIKITIWLCVALIVDDVIRRMVPHGLHPFSDPLSAVGIIFSIAGLALRSWAAGAIRKAKELATAGPYSICRHPLYLGSLLLATGILLLLRCPFNFAGVVLVGAWVYVPKIRQEEAHLAWLFPKDWASFEASTPCLIPRWPMRKQSTQWSLTRWLLNKEYHTVIGSIAALIIIEVWHALAKR